MDKGEYIPPVEKNPIDDFLGKDVEASRYGVAFDRAVQMLRKVLFTMSERVGWKGTEVPFDFNNFSGYYPDLDHVDSGYADICRGQDIIGRFSSDADGRLTFEYFDDEFKYLGDEVNPWYPLSDIVNGKFCLEEGNIEAAKRQSSNGHNIIYGMRFGDACAFAVDFGDSNLRSKLSERELNIRFIDFATLDHAFDRWLKSNATHGFMDKDVPTPEVVVYFYDGQDIRTERELSLSDDGPDRAAWREDLQSVLILRNRCEALRYELEAAAGIPDGSPHFRFPKATTPSTYLRDDAVFLCSHFGIASEDFLTIKNGKVGLYRGSPENISMSVLKATFPSMNDALKSLRSVVLSDENVVLARKDYERYQKSLGEGEGRTPSETPTPKI